MRQLPLTMTRRRTPAEVAYLRRVAQQATRGQRATLQRLIERRDGYTGKSAIERRDRARAVTTFLQQIG